MPSWKSNVGVAAATATAVGLIVVPPLVQHAMAAPGPDHPVAAVAPSPQPPSRIPATKPTPTPSAPPRSTRRSTSAPDPAAGARTRATVSKAPATHDGRKVVYLSIDDGPDPRWTPQMLDLLAQYDARATFFMVGAKAAASPELVSRVRAQGHAIGNHTWDHPWLTKLDQAQVRQQLTRTDAVLGATSCMRPPGGFVNPSVVAVARSLGKSVEMWDVDPRDWARPGSDAVVSTITRGLHPGAVVLLHDGGGDRQQSVQALRTLLPYLQSRGYLVRALPACGATR